MELQTYIFNTHEYHINKGFHKHVKVPFTYLVKVVGIDCDPKKGCHAKIKVCRDFIKEPNEKYSDLVAMFLLLKALRRKRVRTELKKERYEQVEQAV